MEAPQDIELPYDPTIPFLHICLKETKTLILQNLQKNVYIYIHTYIQMYIYKTESLCYNRKPTQHCKSTIVQLKKECK